MHFMLGKIRTLNTQIRSLVLYPIELQAQILATEILYSFEMKIILKKDLMLFYN